MGGAAGDGLSGSRGVAFTTPDRDQDDLQDKNCALLFGGGWWYKNCLEVRNQNFLTGFVGSTEEKPSGVRWFSMEPKMKILSVRMLIRKNNGSNVATENTNSATTIASTTTTTAPITTTNLTTPTTTTPTITTPTTTTTTTPTTTSPSNDTSTLNQTVTPIAGVSLGLTGLQPAKSNSSLNLLETGNLDSQLRFSIRNLSDVAMSVSLKAEMEAARKTVVMFYNERTVKLDVVNPEVCPYHIKGNDRVCGLYGDSNYGGNWFVIQRRDATTSKSFKRPWKDYVDGFGSWATGYWMGLDCIHVLTRDLPTTELLIELTNAEGVVAIAHYMGFSLAPSTSQYQFRVKHSGGGWWFGNGKADSPGNNLNADRLLDKLQSSTKLLWHTWNSSAPVVRTKMSIRHKPSENMKLYVAAVSVFSEETVFSSTLEAVSVINRIPQPKLTESTTRAPETNTQLDNLRAWVKPFAQTVSLQEYAQLSRLAYEAQISVSKYYNSWKFSTSDGLGPSVPPYNLQVRGKACGRFGDLAYGKFWFMVLRRDRATEKQTFNVPWQQYVNGFGNLADGYWLGLECLYLMTNSAIKPTELLIELTDAEGTVAISHYSGVWLDGPEVDYQFHVEKYVLNFPTGDALYGLNGRKFTTGDRDNDGQPDINCARLLRGGWWYDSCGPSSTANFLTGFFAPSNRGPGCSWQTWRSAAPIVRVKILLRSPSRHWLYV
ncbi:hypothetical protein HAZT_HAZT007501 [Hyalella azteca]|uniref:Fibrinogen C-terminal domain-containing protein n=1 Tax=Hyalella azteca TaxID=294128 RepID=A0A6A0H3U3_HYAAZ|nr:hypothetical protein HAZT_HAZT007501 [Hyalella azteca]